MNSDDEIVIISDGTGLADTLSANETALWDTVLDFEEIVDSAEIPYAKTIVQAYNSTKAVGIPLSDLPGEIVSEMRTALEQGDEYICFGSANILVRDPRNLYIRNIEKVPEITPEIEQKWERRIFGNN